MVQRVYNLQEFCGLIDVTRKTVGDWCLVHNAPYERVGNEMLISVPDMWRWRIEREKQARKPQAEDLNEARKRKEIANAEKAEVEVEVLKKNFLPRNIVEKVAFERGQQVKESLNAIADRLTSVLIGQTDESIIRKILQDEVDRILQDISSKSVDVTLEDTSLDSIDKDSEGFSDDEFDSE